MPQPAAPLPNILVITSDEHNPNHLRCAGHPVVQTPTLDRLAAQGTRFGRAYCAQPICAPTRQTFITGLWSFEHGQYSNSHVFDRRHPTWAYHFGAAGYHTACVGKMHTNNEAFHYGFHHRFSRASLPGAIEQGRRDNPATHDPHDKSLFDIVVDDWGRPPRLRGAIAFDRGQYEHDGIMTDESIAFLRRHASSPETRVRPFFLHASLTQPHWPWVLPRDFYYMYDPDTIDFEPPVPGELDHNALASKRFHGFGWDKNSDAVNRLARARYYGAVSWLDHNVGRIVSALDELGLAENTLVLYFTDHGDMAGEKGLWLKSLLYDSAARLPCIARFPGVIPPGAVNHTLINHVDLFPTLAGLTGTAHALPERISGQDLSQCVTGDASGPDFTIAFDNVHRDGSGCAQIMARSARYKLIRYEVDDPTLQLILYDMESDPGETTNLAHDPALASVVEDHQVAIDSFFTSLKTPPPFPVRLARDDPDADKRPSD